MIPAAQGFDLRPTRGPRNFCGRGVVVSPTVDGWRMVPMRMTGTGARDHVRRSRRILVLTTVVG